MSTDTGLDMGGQLGGRLERHSVPCASRNFTQCTETIDVSSYHRQDVPLVRALPIWPQSIRDILPHRFFILPVKHLRG